MEKKTLIIIEARLGSARFPAKVIKKVNNLCLIEHQILRLKRAKKADGIVLATPREKSDIFRKISKKYKINHYEGSEENVLQRVFYAAKKFKAKIVVRSTGDCPLIDPEIVDKVIEHYKNNNFQFVANTLPPTFPDGMDVSVFSIELLKNVYEKAKTKFDKENITSLMRNDSKVSKDNIVNYKDFSDVRLTLDTFEDYLLIKYIISYFKKINNSNFKLIDIMKLRSKNKKIFKINHMIKRNQGSKLSFGQKKWIEAKNLIPGGNMFLSKRPDRILPQRWPVYFSKAKGSHIWDLEGKKYLDFGLMGVGTNILGYSNKYVDDAVIKVIKKSNVSSLNSLEELKLAKKLLEINPWAGMVKFARTGGEANSMAVRIARISSKNENIAICGYHGWHDWYLAANLKNKKTLDTHLLKGLSSIGVPKKLKSTIFTFEYNNYKKLKKLIDEKKIGIIKMEVARSFESVNFISKVRNLCDKKKIILIFDECTSGFRETRSGIHEKYKIYPDIAVYGKALGNGYAITAIVGKEKLMSNSKSSFISSTFWSERLGPTAALKTLELMEKNKTWLEISRKGFKIKSMINKIIKKYNLKIKVLGLKSVIKFKFEYEKPEEFRTYLSQEFLKKKILTTDLIYVSMAHSKEDIKRYLKVLDNVFKKISFELKKRNSIKNLLEVPVADVEFDRLN